MKFSLEGLRDDDREVIERFLENQGHECTEDGVPVTCTYVTENYLEVQYDGAEVKLYGQEKVHLYRAIHLFLVEIIKNDNQPFRKREIVSFKERGLMMDCSRNGAISIQMLEEFIYLCAACGVNQLYLYMEDMYEIPDNAYFGAYRGRYTYEELHGLDCLGAKVGVEIIPCIQTLAHLHTYLRWPNTRKLQDTEDILLSGTKETEAFVRSMIESASRPFRTKKIHVGMDEADMLGLGQYLRDFGYQERYGIMTRHLEVVMNICKEQGLEPMIWSDMFFRLISPKGDYYDLSEEVEFQLEEAFPENLELVYWDYYHHKKYDYDKNFCLHKKITDKVRFAGGGWTWNGISPNYRKAERTLKEGLASCKDHGIKNVMCTFWLDNGAETPIRTAMYSAVYFAELCYEEEIDETSLETWLPLLTGCRKEIYLALDEFDSPEGVLPENAGADNPSKYLLYQDVLLGLFDGQIEGLDLESYYRRLADDIENLRRAMDINYSMKWILSYYNVLARILEKKSMLGVRLRHAYQEDDRETLETLVETIDECISLVEELKELRERIWFEECKPFGYEILDIRLGGVAVRLRSAKKRLTEYLIGRIEEIEELKEQTVRYWEDSENENHRLCQCSLWQNIISAGNIAGV